jgi:Sec-independent protein translocase protein TatA
MFGLSMGEMFLLMAIALIAIGPKQLPEVARTLGKFMNELKRATGDFSRSFADVANDTRSTFDDARKGMSDSFTAGAAHYDSTVRPPPDGTLATADPHHPGDHSLHTTTHISSAGFEADPQGSLFVPTDLTNVQPEPAPNEEQLAFKLTSFDDESDKGDKS